MILGLASPRQLLLAPAADDVRVPEVHEPPEEAEPPRRDGQVQGANYCPGWLLWLIRHRNGCFFVNEDQNDLEGGRTNDPSKKPNPDGQILKTI